MAHLTKKGHCKHCGRKLQEGWGTVCECEGFRNEAIAAGVVPRKFNACAQCGGPTIHKTCLDCRARNKLLSGPGASGEGTIHADDADWGGGEGVGGETSGAALTLGDLPKPGSIFTMKGLKFGVTNVTSMTDGPFPEVTITARMLPKSAVAFLPDLKSGVDEIKSGLTTRDEILADMGVPVALPKGMSIAPWTAGPWTPTGPPKLNAVKIIERELEYAKCGKPTAHSRALIDKLAEELAVARRAEAESKVGSLAPPGGWVMEPEVAGPAPMEPDEAREHAAWLGEMAAGAPLALIEQDIRNAEEAGASHYLLNALRMARDRAKKMLGM